MWFLLDWNENPHPPQPSEGKIGNPWLLKDLRNYEDVDCETLDKEPVDPKRPVLDTPHVLSHYYY